MPSKSLATYESSRDLIEVGAYRAGTTPAVDRAIQLMPALEQFLAQRPDESEARAVACERLEGLLAAEVQDARPKLPRIARAEPHVSDRRKQRLELLYRLREMNVEQARAEHVAAQTELEQRRESAEDTERRLEELDEWTVGQLSQGAPLVPELLRQAQLFRGVEKRTLEQQRAEEADSSECTEAARGQLSARFEELSVVERLAARHAAGRHRTTKYAAASSTSTKPACIRKNHESKE